MAGDTPYRYLDLEAEEDADADDLEGAELENGDDIVEDFINDSEDEPDDEARPTVGRFDSPPKRMRLLDEFDRMELRIRAKEAEKTCQTPSSLPAVRDLQRREMSPAPASTSFPPSQPLSVAIDAPQPEGFGEGFSTLLAIPTPDEIWKWALNPTNNVICFGTRYGMANVAKNKLAGMVHRARNAEDEEEGLFDDLEATRRTIIEECRPEHCIAAVWVDRSPARSYSLYVCVMAPRIAPVLRWFDLHYSHSLLTTNPILIEDVSEKNKLLADFYGSSIHRPGIGWVALNGGRYHGDVGLMMGRGLWVDVLAVPRLNVNWNLLHSMSQLNSNGKRILPPELPRLPPDRRPPLRLFPFMQFTESCRKPSVNYARSSMQYYKEFGDVRFAGPFVVLSCRRDKLLPAATMRADIRQLFLSADHPISSWLRNELDRRGCPALPPVAHWSLEPSELVEDRSSGLKGYVLKVLEKGLIAIEVTDSDRLVHSLEVPWRQIRKVFSVGDFVSVSSPLQQPKTGWVIAAGTEQEARDDVIAIVEHQKALLARRPQEFKPNFVWNQDQQNKVVRLRQRFIQVMSYRRNFDGIVCTEFFHAEKNACVKVGPDTYLQSTHGALDQPPPTAPDDAPCLGTRLQIRFHKARAEDCSNGLRYPNPDKGPTPPGFVRQGFPAFVLEKGYFTGREPWLGRLVSIQGGEHKGRIGHVCGVSVHKWYVKAGAELNARDSSLVHADQKSMKKTESWLWVRVTLYEGGKSTKHDVTVKYDHVVDHESLSPLRIVRPLTTRQVKAGYMGNPVFYRDEAARTFILNGRAFKVKIADGTPSVQPLGPENPTSQSQNPAAQLDDPVSTTPWYAKDFLVGWDLRAIDSRSKATRPQSVIVRVQQSRTGDIEMYRVRKDGTINPEPVDGDRYRPLHPGKKPNIQARWVCFRGSYEGYFVRGIRIQHRASTPKQDHSENNLDWHSIVVEPDRGQKDFDTNMELWPHDEDLVVMADDAETLELNAEYSQRKEGSRDGGRGMFSDGSRRL